MRAWLNILAHPYVAASDASGRVDLRNLPVGESVFQVRHPDCQQFLTRVSVGGHGLPWPRGRFARPIHAGENDLRDVLVLRRAVRAAFLIGTSGRCRCGCP